MEITLISFQTIALATILFGYSDKPLSLPYVVNSDGVIIESSDLRSSKEASKLLRLSITEPVLHDELVCKKGDSTITVKTNGSLQGSFNNFIANGWTCVLFED
ncbi:MAG: hypothetical protein HWE27_17660 [Gammaproteobacteria bacterium]|nr:hypothetical protein [Gammaproteobacteria bacterium]